MNSIASTICRRGMTRRRATAAGWIEQVGDELPLLVGEGDREAHRPRSWPPSVTAQPSEPGDPNGRIRPPAISRRDMTIEPMRAGRARSWQGAEQVGCGGQ